jgi:WD40 repeat protein
MLWPYWADIASAAFSPDGSRIVTGSSDQTAKVWDARSGAEVLSLKGQTESVRSAAFSPDGSRIVTTSGDSAKVWETEPLKPEELDSGPAPVR